MRPQLIFWPDHRSRNGTSTRRKSLGTETLDRNKLANWVGAREIARTTPIRLGIKGRGPDTTVDQSPTEKTTVNNKLSGTILKSRKMTNSQLPAQPSSATMDGKNFSFLRKDWHERSFSRGENHQLFQNFLFHPTYGIIFFLSLQKSRLWGDVFFAKNRVPSRTT